MLSLQNLFKTSEAADSAEASETDSFQDASSEFVARNSRENLILVNKPKSENNSNKGVSDPSGSSDNLNYDKVMAELDEAISSDDPRNSERSSEETLFVYPDPVDSAETVEMQNMEHVADTVRLTDNLPQVSFEPDVEIGRCLLTGRRSSETQFFEDRMRRVDYILAYQPGPECEREGKNRKKRTTFESKLRDHGLHLEHEHVEKSQDGKTCYVKVHAPWEVLARQAEMMKIKMPISVNDVEDNPVISCIDRCLKSWNPFELLKQLRVETEDADYFTAAFSRDLAHQFIMPDKQTFFNSSQRSRMVWDILIRTPYDEDVPTRIGVQRLIKNGSYSATYPLHEGNSHIEPEREAAYKSANVDRLKSLQNDRQLLYEAWARPMRFYKYQPLDLIRKYFGEKIGFYFAWLGFYTWALVPAALVGIICVIYGGSSLPSDEPSIDICDKSGVGNTVMCPNCDTKDCHFWTLSKSCTYAQMTHIFDNTATVIFAVFMSVWGTIFLEGWKRYHATIAWDWDVMDFQISEEAVRPEFQIKVTSVRVNPITKEKELYIPFYQRSGRVLASAVTVVFFLCLVLAFVFGVIVYRVIVSHVFYAQNLPYASMATSASAATLNLVCILFLSKVYQSLAWHLTNWEFPRTESEFENSYTIKVFFFQFINFYSSLFYIAFFKGKFASLPASTTLGESNKLFGYHPETCDPAGCMVELVIQLGIIMVGKQIFNNFMEILFPILQNWWRSRQSNWETEDNAYTRWEKDFALYPVAEMCLFYEYLEMVIQYGFITLFVAAFPLAPLFALLNNIMEIRLDAYKFAVAYRRPMSGKAKDIGIWYRILDGVSRFAVLTNACVIAFTSDFVPRMLYLIAVKTGTLDGFMDDSLAYFDTSQLDGGLAEVAKERNITLCRYRGYRMPPCGFGLPGQCDDSYGQSLRSWHLLAAKLAFVLIFEHLVFLVKGVVAYAIPDIPHHIVIKMQREEYLAKQARYKYELLKAKRGLSDEVTPSDTGVPRDKKDTVNWNDTQVPTANGGTSNLIHREEAEVVSSQNMSDNFHYSPKESTDSLDDDSTSGSKRRMRTKL